MTPSGSSSFANQDRCQEPQRAPPSTEQTRPQPGEQLTFSLTSAVNGAHFSLTAIPSLYAVHDNPENARHLTQRSLRDILQEALDIIEDDDDMEFWVLRVLWRSMLFLYMRWVVYMTGLTLADSSNSFLNSWTNIKPYIKNSVIATNNRLLLIDSFLCLSKSVCAVDYRLQTIEVAMAAVIMQPRFIITYSFLRCSPAEYYRTVRWHTPLN